MGYPLCGVLQEFDELEELLSLFKFLTMTVASAITRVRH
jgi:hypothetical protein